MTLDQRVQKFKYDLLRKHPFYGDIVMQLDFIADRSIPTAATDGLCVKYNPAFMRSLTEGACNFVLMHEVMHILLLHCTRRGDKNPQMWNVAADYIVNDFLTGSAMMRAMRDSGIAFERPKDGLFASLGPGETVENLYAKIVSDNKQNRQNKSGQLSVRKNYGRPADDGTGRWPNSTTITVPTASSGLQGGDLMPAVAGLGNQNAPAEIEAAVQQLIRQASGSEKNRSPFGSAPIPDDIYKLAESKKLNWKSLLKNMLSDIQSDESSWTTPERKYLHMDLILPGHGETEEILENVWAFVDCSGSVGKDEMEEFLTQLYRILKEFHCTMHLAYWDTAVQDVYREIISEKKLLECIPHHSGGTDINCIFQWIRQNKVKPEAMLVLTDGYFGMLTEENGRLRRKTIVVLSKNSARVDDNIRKVGKPASL